MTFRDLMVGFWLPQIVWLAPHPPLQQLEHFAHKCSEVGIAEYPGSTLDPHPPAGWYVNHAENNIGSGRAAYCRAKLALEKLECLQLDWLRANVDGDTLAICARQVFQLPRRTETALDQLRVLRMILCVLDITHCFARTHTNEILLAFNSLTLNFSVRCSLGASGC